MKTIINVRYIYEEMHEVGTSTQERRVKQNDRKLHTERRN